MEDPEKSQLTRLPGQVDRRGEGLALKAAVY